MILIGSYIGVFINVLLPQAIVGVALSFFIIYLSYTTIKKGIKFYKAEDAEKQKKLEVAEKLIQNEEQEKNELYSSLKINEDDDKLNTASTNDGFKVLGLSTFNMENTKIEES